ncbi:acyltransferase [Pantoea stewartii]|uniref:acyltransferase family protein n=1 Tax=Pantoea stewartii TaxID=66269 RepID=UPI0013DE02AB|nr:acyltransferase [Pantoea stewartii]QIE96865.1 acyltransferase [Pantoea stewartii]
MIYTIGYARGLAALFVVLFHFRDYINGVYSQKNLGEILFGPGVSGVDIFFIISGFIIVYSTKKIEGNDIAKFIIRRFFRIYPLLILSVILFTFVTPQEFSAEQIIKSLIPYHLDYSQEAPYFGYNVYVPAWTITYEVVFYSVFVVSMAVSHKYRTLICSSIIILLYLYLNTHFGDGINFDAHKTINLESQFSGAGFFYILSSPMMTEFVFGMILCELYMKTNSIEIGCMHKISSFYLWFCTGIFLTFWFSWWSFGHGPLNFGIWAVIIIPAVILYEKFNIIAVNKKLLFLGDISYSIYMTHIVVVYALGWYADYIPLYKNLSGFSKLFYVVTICISVAYICHVLIEKPMHKFSRKLISKIDSVSH